MGLKEDTIKKTLIEFEKKFQQACAFPMVGIGMTFKIKRNFITKYKDSVDFKNGEPFTVVGPDISDELLITILHREIIQAQKRIQSKKSFMKKLVD
jgi:hypothetical protein